MPRQAETSAGSSRRSYQTEQTSDNVDSRPIKPQAEKLNEDPFESTRDTEASNSPENLPFLDTEEHPSLFDENISPLTPISEPTDILDFAPLPPRQFLNPQIRNIEMAEPVAPRDAYGLPPITETVRNEMNNDKLPKDFKFAPKFDLAEPHKLRDWLEEVTEIFSRVRGLSETAKVRKALHWCSAETKELLAGMDSVKEPDFNKFKDELQIIFAESIGDIHGSRRKLSSLVERFEPIRVQDAQKLRIFNKLFKAEATKLMQEPALISNSDAVRLYRAVFDDTCRDAVTVQVRQDVDITALRDRRREDPYMLEEVMNTAEKVQSGGALFDVLYGTKTVYSPHYQPANATTYRRGPIALPFAPEIPKGDESYLKDYKKVKQERSDDFGLPPMSDLKLEELAREKDTNDIFMKELRTVSEQFKEGMGIMNQLTNIVVKSASTKSEGSTERVAGQLPMPSVSQLTKIQGAKPVMNRQGNPATLRDMACFMCKSKDHLMYDCPYYKEYLRRGWLVLENPNSDSKRVQLKDGMRMPYEEPGKTRWQTIEQIAKEHKWDKAEAYFANMMEAPEEDYSSQLDPNYNMTVWLSKLDEISERLGNMETQREEDL